MRIHAMLIIPGIIQLRLAGATARFGNLRTIERNYSSHYI